MSDKLRLFKLFTSEEVVVKVLKEEEDYFLVEKPRLCALRQEQDPTTGQVTGNFLVLMPWMVYATNPETGAEEDIKLYKTVIAGETEKMPTAIEKEWLHVTSSIQLLS